MTETEKKVLTYCLEFTLLADHSGNLNKTFVKTVNNLLVQLK